MDHDQYLHWSEYYLFQEALVEVIDIWSITRDLRFVKYLPNGLMRNIFGTALARCTRLMYLELLGYTMAGIRM